MLVRGAAKSTTDEKNHNTSVLEQSEDILRPLFQLGTRSYDKEIRLVKKAMQELEIICNVKNGYKIFEPFTKAGWTFFNIQISDEMFSIIEKSGMEGALGFKIGEQFKNYLGHYLESKGSQVRITQIDY